MIRVKVRIEYEVEVDDRVSVDDIRTSVVDRARERAPYLGYGDNRFWRIDHDTFKITGKLIRGVLARLLSFVGSS